MDEFRTLGNNRAPFTGLETFKAPEGVKRVMLTTDEVTALCPVTKQPDWYTVQVEYSPAELCVESKSFKLYVQSFRNEGLFCEALASRISKDLCAVLKTPVEVCVAQKPRGGVSIVAEAS